MKQGIAMVVLLMATCSTASESFEQDFTDESLSIEGDNEHAIEAITETKTDSRPLEPDQRAGGEVADATIDPAIAAHPPAQPDTTESVTLDELLRQTRNTPHLQQEALLARLAERRRLAIAIRSTLEAAEQVAAFGKPGTQLLQDASLDMIVATMITDREHAHAEQEKPAQSETSNTQMATQTLPQTAEEIEVSDSTDGFGRWHPVYIVQDARGHKVGWRHQATGERAITYVGKRWEVGEDTVTVEGVASDGVGRYVIVSVNGERREIHL